MAFAMAATHFVCVKAEPAKSSTDGREAVHFAKRSSHTFFDSELWQRSPFSDVEFKWPKIGLGKAPKAGTGGPEQAHIEVQHFLYFSGSDVWPRWAFAHAGVLWSPSGLNNEGFTLKFLLGSGIYGYHSGALDNTNLNQTNVIGRQSSFSAMPGWRFKRAGYEVTVYAGFDLQVFTFYPPDPATRLAGRYMGVRGGVELWHEPSPTTMLAADASVSSIGAGNSSRIAFGWRLLDRFYLGPEAQIYSTDSYLHKRVGVHLTAFRIDGREWSGAIGLASDNDNRNGVYVRLNVLTRR